MRRTFFLAVIAGLILESWSFLGWQFPALNIGLWIAGVGLAGFLAWRWPVLAVALVMLELVLGGKGYLASVTVNGAELSLRLGIFLAVFAAVVIRAIRTRQLWGTQRPFRWFWVGLVGIIFWAVCVGLLRNHGLKPVFLDANAFLFVGLIPLFGLLKNRQEFLRVCAAFGGALAVLALKTGVVQTLFNHVDSTSLVPLYKWVRDTGVGEITYIIGHLYRVFFQSHVFGLLGFAVGLGLSVTLPKQRWAWRLAAAAGFFVVAVSLSRSFWLGGGGALLLGLGVFFLVPSLRKQWRPVLMSGVIAVVLALAAFQWALNFPLLWGGGFSGGSLVRSRANIVTESAASSRRELLPVMNGAISEHPLLGSGFGTALTYRTKDPRVAGKGNAEGVLYTTTAFELGYHAFALQFGLPLLLLYAGLLGWFFWQGFQKVRHPAAEQVAYLGFWVGGLALCILHLTTPYLNHPLGLGLLMLVASAFTLLDKEPANA